MITVCVKYPFTDKTVSLKDKNEKNSQQNSQETTKTAKIFNSTLYYFLSALSQQTRDSQDV